MSARPFPFSTRLQSSKSPTTTPLQSARAAISRVRSTSSFKSFRRWSTRTLSLATAASCTPALEETTKWSSSDSPLIVTRLRSRSSSAPETTSNYKTMQRVTAGTTAEASGSPSSVTFRRSTMACGVVGARVRRQQFLQRPHTGWPRCCLRPHSSAPNRPSTKSRNRTPTLPTRDGLWGQWPSRAMMPWSPSRTGSRSRSQKARTSPRSTRCSIRA